MHQAPRQLRAASFTAQNTRILRSKMVGMCLPGAEIAVSALFVPALQPRAVSAAHHPTTASCRDDRSMRDFRNYGYSNGLLGTQSDHSRPYRLSFRSSRPQSLSSPPEPSDLLTLRGEACCSMTTETGFSCLEKPAYSLVDPGSRSPVAVQPLHHAFHSQLDDRLARRFYARRSLELDVEAVSLRFVVLSTLFVSCQFLRLG